MDDSRLNEPDGFGSDQELPTRRYVNALGALDSAAGPSSQVGASSAAAAADVARMNAIWNTGESSGGALHRIWTEIGRWLPWRRRRMQGAMIAAINRNAETTRALIDATQAFQAHVIWYAQTVSGITSGRTRAQLATTEGIERLDQGLRALSADWMKRWESLAVREQRYEARTTSVSQAYQNVLEVAELAQQNAMSLKRSVDILAAHRRAVEAGMDGAPATPPASAGPSPLAGIDTDAYKYRVFEDRYRGSSEEIRRRLSDYPALFEGATNVLDIGCGRGELLELLDERGVGARGIDINEEMVEASRARGLTADRADALSFLETQPDGSLGGIIAIQVVEHLRPDYLIRVIEMAYQKLKPGAPLVLETINAACWAAFFDSYIRDFTHVRPLHPETLRYLVQASGFAKVDLRYLSPIPEHDKLPLVRVLDEREVTPTIVELVEAMNAHANRLNSQLFTYRDFAIVARR